MKDIYFFEEGNKDMTNILGNKGANLCEIYNLGLPIPYGFIIPINKYPIEIDKGIKKLESKYGKLGEGLFVSVRSSAPISMPGMMDSVLNIGSYEELNKAIKYVLNSWNNRRAIVYREKYNIPHNLGTAIIIQKMVFGNKNKDSATGIVFSSNPNNNLDKNIIGEVIFNAQGIDLVSGLVTPLPINKLNKQQLIKLEKIAKQLESYFNEIQEIEFTIEDNKLFILQTRDTKKKNKVTRYKIKNKNKNLLLSTGIPASYGAASGKIVFSSNQAKRLKEKGEKVILVRPETNPEDLEGIIASEGIVTLIGGATSHAAVVARSLNKPCVCGCGKLQLNEYDWITIDGFTGEIFLGELELIKIKDI